MAKRKKTLKKHHPAKRTLKSRRGEQTLKDKSESSRNDIQLINSALKGNQSAYEQLMKKYHDQITNLILRIIHQREQVEDLTQEVFIKAFSSLKHFDEKYAFSTWLYKIATNSSIDYLRKKKLSTFSINKPIQRDETDSTYELPDTSYIPDKHIIQKQRITLLQKAIEKLPERYKRVIILRHTEERDYREIAKILNLPIGTVKAHIFRARELLNKYLRHKISHY